MVNFYGLLCNIAYLSDCGWCSERGIIGYRIVRDPNPEPRFSIKRSSERICTDDIADRAVVAAGSFHVSLDRFPGERISEGLFLCADVFDETADEEKHNGSSW